MSTVSALEMLNGDGGFMEAWGDLEDGFRGELEAKGIKGPIIWAGLIGRSEDPRSRLMDALSRMGVLNPGAPGEVFTERLNSALRVAQAARDPARTWADQMAHVPNMQLHADRAVAARAQADREVEQDRKRLKTGKAFQLPAVWRGKKYRRAEQEGDLKAQQKAEDAERAKWAKKVVELLVEAKLLFGREVAQRGLTPGSPETTRCLRGLRWTSLKKRVSDWEPARRWLLAISEPAPSPTLSS